MGLFPKDRDLTQPPEHLELVVDASAMGIKVEEVHVRLDTFLARHLKWRSRASIQHLIRDGWLRIDPSSPDHPQGRGEYTVERRPGRKLHHGSRVMVVIPPDQRLPVQEGASSELVVLYEDAAVLAVDKPPLLPVHPSGRHYADTLIQRVHARYQGLLASEGRAPRLCHRLDRETSGIVLVGKDPDLHPLLMAQFENREVEKEYLAVVEGEVREDEGRVELPIGPARASGVRLKMAAAVDGLPSRTDWRVLERYPGHALLACRLHTGRQHQIRVHLASIGLPVVGDKLYGPDETLFQRGVEGELTEEDLALLKLPRHALHNHRLAFVTPAGGVRVEVVSPLPMDLCEFLNGLA